jgi:phosphohistidine swiveling domain-containing protein
VYHDYYISPVIKAVYDKIPEKMKINIQDYTEILGQQGFTVPNVDRSHTGPRPSYMLPFILNGVVGKNIFISTDVTPEAVLKLKNTKCIISEEGGVLSHAAIIAKEFNIPFIAGIKGATRLFHNGDRLSIRSNRLHIYINNKTKKKNLRIELT